MPLSGPTVREIREEYGREQALLLTETFNTRAKAAQSEPDIAPSLRNKLSDGEFNGLRAAQAAEVDAGLHESLREQYIEKDLEMVAAVEEREKRILEYLAPKEATSEALGQFMDMGEEQIIQAADVAATAQMVDTLRLLLSVAQQRDLDLAENHIAGLMDEDGWPDLLAELFEASQVKELEDAEDRWETLAQPPSTKESFLVSPQADMNIYGQMR